MRRSFRYQDVTIAVQAHDLTHVSWLEEFLSPPFAVDDDGAASCEVSLTVDPRRYADLVRRGRRPDGASMACFANDTSLTSLPLWSSADAERIVFDRRSNVFYVVRPEQVAIEIVAGRSTIAVRPALMRVVRELAMMHAAGTGGLLLHGGAIVAGGNGFVIAGPKRSGKTTLLMHVLRAARVGFAANDRVAVFADGSVPTVRGLPTIITIRHQTARQFPELRPWLHDSTSHYRRRLSETPATGAGSRRGGHHPVSMSPAQFCSAMQVPARADARLAGLVFPRVTGRPGPLVMTRLDRTEAAARLRAGLFRADAPVTLAPGLAILPAPATPPASRDRLCTLLLDAVRMFDCELGRDAYRRADALTGLVRDVLTE